jgi:hypothetical protein
MLIIDSTAAMALTLDAPIDIHIRRLLYRRQQQLCPLDEYDLGDLVRFVVVDCGDDLAAVTEALGFSPFTNFVDGSTFGSPGFEPSAEVIIDHGEAYEIVFILSDDGFGTVLIVPNREGVDIDLLSFCRAYSEPA